MNESKNASSNMPLIAVFIVGAIVTAAVAFVLMNGNRSPSGAPEPISDGATALTNEQASELMRKAQLANGYLENVDFAKADVLYSEIIEQLPEEPLAIRNQAICRYLLLEQQKIDRAEVEASLARLLEVEPKVAATHWLLGKTASKGGPSASEKAAEHFHDAAKLEPEEPLFWYEAYDAARISIDGEEKAKEFLRHAYEIAPDNLFLLGDWLVALAQAKDESTGDALRAAKDAFAPLRDTVLKRHGADVFEQLDKAIEAFEKGEWNMVVRYARVCMNITRPNDFTQGDKRSLAPHALEFVVHEFSEDFLQQYAATKPDMPLIDIEFTRMPATISGEFAAMHMVDIDLDTKLEILALDSAKLTVYQQDDAAGWHPLTSVELSGSYSGILAADLDRDRDHKVNTTESEANTSDTGACFDADSDVVLYGESGLLFLRNNKGENGERSLEIIEQESLAEIRDVVTAVLVDFDHDSNLDVVCSTVTGLRALLGRGEMVFGDVSQFSSFPNLDDSHPITSLAAVDWDRDVDIDIVAVAADHSLGYLENLRHGNFRWKSFADDFAKLSSATSIAVVESDGNVSWDLVGTTTDGVTLLQTRTPHSGKVQFKAAETTDCESRGGLFVADLDNNGFQDAVAWDEDSLSLLRAKNDGSFAAQVPLADLPAEIQHCDFGDVDADGDIDVCVAGKDGIVLLENAGGNANNWLSVRAMGQVDNAGKANHHGIGSLLEVKAGSMYQAQVVSRPVTHFGLGQEPNAAIIRFLWTNGVPQDKLEPAANQAMCEVMTLKGSCPYIYTWTGERFEFLTDCLWAAPIGLQLAEDVLAPSRSWEYLKIPANRLREKDGHYALQVTEELWEAGYFDLVELIAVDHPADVEVYSNEKVGPASISEYKLYTVKQRKLPVAARDQRGRDVSEKILHRDGDFLRAFDKTIVPGLAEEHFLELDLGELESPEQIVLFLTGWIYPTDTSMNVALSRHPQVGGPRPPAVHVPDEHGDWKEVQAYMGFPGGKTKTISVDLSDAFITDDYRVRIVTSAEIYWDEAFFTIDEEPVDLRLTKLTLESADLHYRGFSQSHEKKPNAPETYDYSKLQVAAKWPPMRGGFTRYGDVLELVNAEDDRMAILGGGDEMTLRFRAPDTPLPDGWVRDFVMHNVGWDKDADLNTVYGQSVEPLPFRAMAQYPYGPEASFPNSPAHQQYLQQYQTRFQKSQRFWRRIKDYQPAIAN